MRREDLHLALLGICGAERHGAVAVLGEGLAGDYVPEYGIENVRRGALFLRDPVTGTQWPAIGADGGGEEEVGAVERPVVPRGEFVGEEDRFGNTAAGQVGAVAVSSGICATGQRMW